MSIDKVHMQYVSSLYSVLMCIVQLKGPKDQKHINTNVLIDTQYTISQLVKNATVMVFI